MKFHIKTYGCQMNERDSEAAAAALRRAGHLPAAGEGDADIVIVNTCSVRAKAEDKALGKLGLLVAARRARPRQRIGVMGCMVQRLRGSLFTRVPGLDFAVGTQRLSRLPQVIERAEAGESPVLEAGDSRDDEEVLAGHEPAAGAAFVNVLYGCDRRCTYCIVPAVRGPEWSRPGSAVIEEVTRLAAEGVREVTLLGQSVMSYGRRNAVWPEDYRSSLGFAEPLPRLLEALSGIAGLERLRFTSGHPSGCTDELARAMAALPAVCEHLHLPLQSGSDRILGLMQRGYDADGYRQAVARLRRAVPDLALTTDLIVGFPTETVEDFERTRALMREIGFDNSFIFKYSPRPDTVAAGWPDDVPQAEKRRRNQILLADQDELGLAANQRWVGRTVEVLVEGVSLRNARRWSGRTRTDKIVIFDPIAGTTPGDSVWVTIERAMPQTFFGTICEPPAGARRPGGDP